MGLGLSTWLNLSSQAAGFTTPDRDPSGIYSSISSDVTGTTITANNSATTNGYRNGASWNFPSAFSLFGGAFGNNENLIVLLRGTVVTHPAAAVNMWMGVGLSDPVGVAASPAGLGLGALLGTVTHNTVVVLTTSFSSIGAAHSGKLRAITSRNPAFSSQFFQRIGTTTINISTITYANDGGSQFFLACGFNSNTNNGPHTAKILWEANYLDPK